MSRRPVLSPPATRLPTVPWWGWLLIVWGPASAAAAVIIGGIIRNRNRQTYTPQLDVPLWRGTDLPQPGDLMPTIITSRCTLADPPQVTFTEGQVWLRWDDAGVTVRLDPDEAGDLCDQLIDALDLNPPEN